MRKLRVAHVMNGIGLGGVPPIVQQLMSALPRDRYDLFLYCLKRHGDDAAGRQARIKEFEDAGFPVRFPEPDEKLLQILGRVCEWIDADAIDVLHTHSYKPNLLGRMAAALSGRPSLRTVAHYHNFYDDKWTAEGTLPLDRRLTRASDRLIACSEAVREHMVERLEVPRQSIEVILNGVDLARFSGAYDVEALRSSLGIPPGMRVVASVGRVSRQKASDDVVRAARMICDARKDCVFVLAGADDDPFTPTVRRMVADLGLADRVIFTGHLSDVAPLYALADVVVMPSRWEGFGLVLVEAMASGTPLVTTAVGPIPEVVGEGSALMIRPDAPADLARAVLDVLDDPHLARSLAARGRERARTFSWARAGERLDAVYADLAAESRA
jgi:glycosyltransferase involved in cell wall biosynthesis